MTRAAERASIIEELRDVERHPSAQTRLNQYLAWCEKSGIGPLPADGGPTGEQILLVYLQAETKDRGWGYENTKAMAGVVARWMTRHGNPDPRTALVSRWMKSYRNVHGVTREQPVDAVSLDEIREAVIEDSAIADWAVALNAIVTIADASADCLPDGEGLNPFRSADLRALESLGRSSFKVTGARIVVDVTGRRVIIGRARQPLHYELVAAALQGDDPEPLHHGNRRALLRCALRRVAPRLVVAGSYPVNAASARVWWGAAASADRMRLTRHMDGDARRRAQVNAMRLLALNGLHRAAEIRRFTIGQMVPRGDGSGYEYVLEKHKGALLAVARGTEPSAIRGSVDHVASGRGDCPPTCPACALGRHLEYRRDSGAADGDFLFVSNVNGGQITAGGMAGAMRRTARDLVKEDGTPRRIGSRSARVTGATELRKAGASIDTIMEAGGWRDPYTASLYLRRHDPRRETGLVLAL